MITIQGQAAMADANPLQEQFDDLEQQRTASTLGIWIFLATEALFFGGLFTAYTVNRFMYPDAFAAAAAHTDVLIGTINTAILLTSSLFAALAVKEERTGDRGAARRFLLLTIALGTAFLGFKGYEYWKDVQEGLWVGPSFALTGPPARLFFSCYWIMTFVHVVHVTVGIGIFVIVFRRLRLARGGTRRPELLEIPALYWHFVDIIWIFLYPLLYLVGRAA